MIPSYKKTYHVNQITTLAKTIDKISQIVSRTSFKNFKKPCALTGMSWLMPQEHTQTNYGRHNTDQQSLCLSCITREVTGRVGNLLGKNLIKIIYKESRKTTLGKR